MKKQHLFIIIIYLLISNLMCIGQNKKSLIFDLSYTQKGELMMIDDALMRFTNLYPQKDSITFYASNSFFYSYPARNIPVTSSEKSDIEKGAIIGGISGLVVGVLAGGIANPDNSAIDLLGDIIKGNDASGSLNQDQVPFIVGGTLAGAAIGILIGSIERKTALQKMNIEVDFQTALASIPFHNNEFVLSVNLSLN